MNPSGASIVSDSVSGLASSSDPTSAHDARVATTADSRGAKPAGGGKKESWLSTKAQKLADWLATSEPSAQALSQHRKECFRRAGISENEAEPHTKLQSPIGQIPPDAIKAAGGPSPEEVAQKKASERRKKKKKHKHPDGTPGAGTASSSESWSVCSGQESTSDSLNTWPYVGSSR
jgi:hypothetical protein